MQFEMHVVAIFQELGALKSITKIHLVPGFCQKNESIKFWALQIVNSNVFVM